MNKTELLAVINALPDDIEVEKSSIDTGLGKEPLRAPAEWEDATIRLRIRVVPRPVVVPMPNYLYRAPIRRFTLSWALADGTCKMQKFETLQDALLYYSGVVSTFTETKGASVNEQGVGIVWARDPGVNDVSASVAIREWLRGNPK